MSYDYVVGGQAVSLEVDPDLVGIRYSEPAPHSFRAQFSATVGADFNERFEIPNEKFTLLKTPAVAPTSVSDRVITELQNGNLGISRTAPVFKIGTTRILATDRILVGLKDSNDALNPLLSGINYKLATSRGFGEYTVTLASNVDPLAAAKQLQSIAKFSYVEPDFVNVVAPLASADINSAGAVHQETEEKSAASSFLAAQYAISITKAYEAWKIKTGIPGIRIAILDEGVDTKHPDLEKSIAGSFDAADNDEFQEPNAWDGHGTACAGLAAAVPHDASGVHGIAWGCSILAVRIAYSQRPGGPWATTNSAISAAIDWSWRNQADVLSNSWGGGAPSNAIVNAFNRAKSLGRSGKGCVIVVAAGNEQAPVSFPANLPDVICVAASNEKDEIKSKTSSDGEDWWGSNFGPEVIIAAPGVHNLTTDITGPSGYNTAGNYFATFNGTSSATPLVAGACGLILSVSPDLSSHAVSQILRNTADKVGNTPYVNERNDQFGYGRLNVLRAVQAAGGLHPS